MFCNFIRFDLKNGLLKKWRNYLVALLTFLSFFLIHYLRLYAENKRLRTLGEEPLSFTVSDLILTVIGGTKEFRYENGAVFLFPALWIFFFLLLLFFTLYYPTHNLAGIGKNMLVLSQSRRVWWLSKCIWCVCSVLTYFALFYLAAFMMGVCLGGEPTIQPSAYIPHVLDAEIHIKNPPWNILPGLILAPCVTCGIALLQMLLTLYIRPIFAYITSCVLLLSSACFSSPFLIGNYAMLFRTEIFAAGHGITLTRGFSAAILLILASVFIGCFKTEHMDILTTE